MCSKSILYVHDLSLLEAASICISFQTFSFKKEKSRNTKETNWNYFKSEDQEISLSTKENTLQTPVWHFEYRARQNKHAQWIVNMAAPWGSCCLLDQLFPSKYYKQSDAVSKVGEEEPSVSATIHAAKVKEATQVADTRKPEKKESSRNDGEKNSKLQKRDVFLLQRK